jgi:putative Holliday junction resolvase
MRVMAIDYGEARTGLCVSDLTGTLPGEAWVVEEWNAQRLADRIARETAARGVSTLVLGLPRNMDGSEGPRAEKSRALAQLLRDAGAPDVVLWDERRTTVDAHRILHDNGKREIRHKKSVDAVAASLILEAYLNSIRK